MLLERLSSSNNESARSVLSRIDLELAWNTQGSCSE